jgi:hypothetical protein
VPKLYAVPLLLLAAGCDSLCVEGVGDVGDRLRVTVIERWNEQSQYTYLSATPGPDCAFDADLGPGSTFLVRIDSIEHEGPQCLVRIGTPRELEGVEFLGKDLGAYTSLGSPIFSSRHRVRVGETCSGIWTITLGKLFADPLSEPIPGQHPPAVMIRRFGTRTPEQCGMTEESSRCFFVIRLERVK